MNYITEKVMDCEEQDLVSEQNFYDVEDVEDVGGENNTNVDNTKENNVNENNVSENNVSENNVSENNVSENNVNENNVNVVNVNAELYKKPIQIKPHLLVLGITSVLILGAVATLVAIYLPEHMPTIMSEFVDKLVALKDILVPVASVVGGISVLGMFGSSVAIHKARSYNHELSLAEYTNPNNNV